MNIAAKPESLWERFELPTWLLLAGVYLGWFALTLCAAGLPWWLVLPCGAFLTCLHGSLQHEALHGHPTRNEGLNTLLVSWPIGLWMPYGVYKECHAAHHGVEVLTDPHTDPESYYFTEAVWRQVGPVGRRLLVFNNTLAGRLLVGPAIAMFGFGVSEIKRLFRGDFSHLGCWLAHLLPLAVLLYWVLAVCDLPFWQYVVLFAYPGQSLVMLRSFVEHRPETSHQRRTVIIEGSWLTRLLYLNNNYHAVHHDRPGLAWFRLKPLYEADPEAVLSANGGFYFRDYVDIARRHLFTPKDLPVQHRG